MNNRPVLHPTTFANNNNNSIPTDSENALPIFQKQQMIGNNMGPIKPSTAQQQTLKKAGGDSSGQKRKALVDITNTQKANQQQNNQLQPAKKKIKSSNPIQVFNDNPTSNTSKHLQSQQIKSKNKLTQQLNKNSMRPSLKFSNFDDEIEYCPQVEEIIEHPTPIFTEFNLQTGEAEDIYVTLSDERMNEITKPPTYKPGSFLSFDVIDSITTCGPLSPSPKPLSPIDFDIFNFEVL